MKPDSIKILTLGTNPMVMNTDRIPNGLTKKCDVPHKCGKLFRGKDLYGYYAYIYKIKKLK